MLYRIYIYFKMIEMFKVQFESMHFFFCFCFIKIRSQLFAVVDSALISKLYYQNEARRLFFKQYCHFQIIIFRSVNIIFNPSNSCAPDGNVCFHVLGEASLKKKNEWGDHEFLDMKGHSLYTFGHHISWIFMQFGKVVKLYVCRTLSNHYKVIKR